MIIMNTSIITLMDDDDDDDDGVNSVSRERTQFALSHVHDSQLLSYKSTKKKQKKKKKKKREKKMKKKKNKRMKEKKSTILQASHLELLCCQLGKLLINVYVLLAT